MVKSLKRLHAELIGSNADTTLQARIFHEVSLIALVGLPLGLLVNLLIKVPLVNVVLSATWIVIGAMYINSRYFGRLRLSLIMFTIGTSVLMGFNYFINSGYTWTYINIISSFTGFYIVCNAYPAIFILDTYKRGYCRYAIGC